MEWSDRLRAQLTDGRLERLGLRPDDAAATRELAYAVLADRDDMERVGLLADRLVAGIGDLVPEQRQVFDPQDATGPLGRGVLPLMALLATADAVHAYHRSRGVDDDVSWASLADLGRQVWVNRLTYGEPGLHTQDWLTLCWSGALLQLGRLQLALDRLDVAPHRGTVVLSVHVPQTGPLDPDAVEDSFAQAERAFGQWYADIRPQWFHCESWLLDETLAAGLPGSNIAAFAAQWELFGEPSPGTDDAVFFTFRRRGEVDPDTLPTTSRLEQLVVSHLRSGEPLTIRHGRRAMADGHAR
ncbi:acyltransferase domain-containing protein [Mariniluteicoccus endophyticus]